MDIALLSMAMSQGDAAGFGFGHEDFDEPSSWSKCEFDSTNASR